MNKEIVSEISKNLNIKDSQVEAVLKLLEDGNTIPFIARYRKEATGALNEEIIRQINEVYEYQVNLLKRKEDVIRLIDEKGLMTPELKDKIMASTKLVEVEDLYRPYKEKKKTKATDAINNGLEPLAKMIMSFPETGSIKELCAKFLNDKVKTTDDAMTGAKYIIAEWISDNASYRKWIRMNTYIYGTISSKLKKNAQDDNKTFEMYYKYSESLKSIKLYRVLALNRGEKLGILNVSIDIDTKMVLDYLENKIIKRDSFVNKDVKEAIADAYDRLIKGSIEREIRAELTEKAEVIAIDNFSKNLEHLLLTPPMKDKRVLGFDPAFRTGCKLAVLDNTGKVLDIGVIYPHEPKNDFEGSKKIMLDLINKYNIDIVAIGNGTASRESEAFVAKVIKEANHKVEYVIVSEAGASVYSASKLAISEFPDLTVEKRSAISIGRRLQDPLAELVKVDPESIGVGLYQHDVSNKELTESLDFVVEKTVNQVGVNINSASPSLLEHISGLNKKNIDKIIDYRDNNGKISSREELKKKKLLPDKAYEQSIGFLRILDGKNILDQTDIHPESYGVTLKLLDKLNININDIGNPKLNDIIKNVDIESMSKELNIDTYTLEDILKSLVKPHRDPRDEMPKPLLKSDILTIKDLKKGMKLQGTVRNVVDFGAFVDIGLHNDGLIHISKMSTHYIKHPSEILSVGDIIDCYVDEVYPDKEKVALSLLEPIK
jgi:uncharacterized protein